MVCGKMGRYVGYADVLGVCEPNTSLNQGWIYHLGVCVSPMWQVNPQFNHIPISYPLYINHIILF
ncbi:MAG: hypothetical protein ACTSQD_06950 [Promethearchaeota archaeon]